MPACTHLVCGGGQCLIAGPLPAEATDAELASMEVELERSILLDSLDAFTRWAWPRLTGAELVPNRATDTIVRALQDVAEGRITRLLIALPPGVGKSTLLAAYAAWRLVRDPTHRAIHAGHAAHLADTESRRVRRFVESDDFRGMFGLALRHDENTAAHWVTEQGGRYISVGVETSLLGRRANEAVLDDPLDANDRFSRAAKAKLAEWFFGSLTSRLDGIGSIIVTQQRLCRDDLIGVLAEFDGWTLISLPAEDEDGNLLAPTVLTREKLDEKRQQSPSAYSTMYLQRPSDDANAAIPRAWWRFHRQPHVAIDTAPPIGCNADVPPIPTPDAFDAQVITVDMTFGGQKKTNDFACIQVWGRKRATTGKQLFILIHQWRKRASQLEQRKALRTIMSSFPRAKVHIENAAGGAGAIEELVNDGIPVEPIQALGAKETRLGLYAAAPIEEGRVLLPLGASYLEELVEELAGGTGHDDAQDCLVYACAILNQQRPSVWDHYRKSEPSATMPDGGPVLSERGGIANIFRAINGNMSPFRLEEQPPLAPLPNAISRGRKR